MNRFMQALVWLRRIHRCRGFGIQSPTDYQFVREVVNEHSPYYAYSVVGLHDSWSRKKIGRLCLRVANHLQPKTIIDMAGYGEYLAAGCRTATLCNALEDTEMAARTLERNATAATLVVADVRHATPELLNLCGKDTTLILEGIGKHKRQWETVRAHNGVTVSFDLYYCGIATFNDKRAKQNYIVNF